MQHRKDSEAGRPAVTNTAAMTNLDDNREYLLEAGYRWRVDGRPLDTMPFLDEYEELPQSGWRRVLYLWGAPNIPFFRASWT